MTREDRIQHILNYMTFSEKWVIEEGGAWEENEKFLPKPLLDSLLAYTKLPLTYFHGAELAYDEDFEIKSYETMVLNPFHPDNRELITMDLGLWQQCGLNLPDEDFPQREKATGMYHLQRIRKVPLKELRGCGFRLSSGDIAEWSQAWLYNDGSFSTDRTLMERRGSDWWCIGQPKHPIPPFLVDERLSQSVSIAKSVAFTRYYDWHVEVGFEMPGRTSLPTVSLATDATGARQAYRLRDLAPGKSRREALRHWVNEHWRKKASDPDEETKIWAHLRGTEEFTHNGMKCRIVPSEYDLKKAAEYQKKSQERPREKRRAQHG